MVTEKEKQLITEMFLGNITKEAFLREYPVDIDTSDFVLNLMEESLKSRHGIDVELVMMVGGLLGYSKKHVPVLSLLLTEDWHRKHEDIAKALQMLKDPRCMDQVVKAMHMKLDYWFDSGDAFIRKCAYVLGDINTKSSMETLKELSSSPNEIIRKYSLHQLRKHGFIE